MKKAIEKLYSPENISKIERNFDDAITRLISGTPKNAALKLLHEKGKLKIHISSVALEAGRSRTLIALESCRFPKIRSKILNLANSESGALTSMAVLQKLRQENKNLLADLDKSRTLQLAAFYEKEDAVKEARRWRDAHQRQMKKSTDTTKVVALVTSTKGNRATSKNHE